MTHRHISLRWLVGGIYFCIMVVILGGLALYLSHLIAQNYMDSLTTNLSGRARLGAELLAPSVKAYYTTTVKMDALSPTERTHLENLFRGQLLPGDQTRLRNQFVQEKYPEKGFAYLPDVKANIIGYLRKINSLRQQGGTTEIAFFRFSCVMRTNRDLIAESLPYSVSPPFDQELPESIFNQALDPERADGIGAATHFSEKFSEELLYIAVPIRTRTVEAVDIPDGILVLAAPTTNVRQTIGQIQGGILLAFIGGLLVLFLINAAVSIFVTHPLNTLSQAAGHFAGGDLQRRVRPTGAHEIASLGESFNSMAAQLESTIAHLDEQRAQAQAILASMFDGVLVTDPAGRILLINQCLERTFDLRAEEIVGQELADTLFQAELNELLEKTIDTDLPLMHQVAFSRPVPRTFEVHMAPVKVGAQLLGVVIALYDVTTQRKLEQVQRDFVANVSHELRTPVASIRAMAETLADGGSEDPQIADSFLGSIIHESERLTELLEDLLQLSQIESGRRLITPEWVDLAEIIRSVVERLAPLIDAKAQRMVLEIPARLPAYVDRGAILQTVLNLIDNARKYSPEGGAVTVHAERADDGRLRVKVTDTGIGIPEEELDRIFERFYRVDKARSRAEGGTGLGLAIVQHLVELHGGLISVQSELGQGSQFTVVLPQPKEDTALPGEAGEPPFGDILPVAGSDAGGSS
ncbi:MAG: two-component system histidine kinase PnpS [Armatimonadota bacterium]